MACCSQAREQNNFLSILSIIRSDEIEFNTINFVLPHAGVRTLQNPTLLSQHFLPKIIDSTVYQQEDCLRVGV